MPRPSRLSERGLSKNPVDKEVTKINIVKRLLQGLYQIIPAATAEAERILGRVQTQSQRGQASGASVVAKSQVWSASAGSKDTFSLEGSLLDLHTALEHPEV